MNSLVADNTLVGQDPCGLDNYDLKSPYLEICQDQIRLWRIGGFDLQYLCPTQRVGLIFRAFALLRPADRILRVRPGSEVSIPKTHPLGAAPVSGPAWA